ncbi:MAG: pantetheine-phosphate adenylyltransferase [Terrimicrobiaceae bacterium]
MKRGAAIYPGSFDPVTLGHMDIIQRAGQMFETLIVAVAENEAKAPLFDMETRIAMIQEAVGPQSRIVVKQLRGLLVNFAREEGIFVVVRGLRAVSDFEFEFQMALMNRRLEPNLETIFLTPQEEYTFLSSRIVKEVARLGGDVTPFVPPHVAAQFRTRSQKM